MKVGDKCWVYLNLEQRIQQGTIFNVGGLVEVRWPYADPLIKDCARQWFLPEEVFPTRDALCEHYRKIFK